MPVTLEQSTQKLLNHIIAKQCFLKDYPKPGVVFLAIDALFNDPHTRDFASEVVAAATNTLSFDSVAGVASRGYIFSGRIGNQASHKGEQFIQKVKVKGDPRFNQLGTKTEYSSDDLQVLKGTIQKGKNYLVADDLIATGGSIMTSVDLIRKSGGTVDKVFVMTELLDFGARELLKKAGIELISLMKFNQADLQKLLELQEAYQQNKHAPISYQLSHHAGELTPVCTVHVASQSSLKLDGAQLAVQETLDPLSIEMIGHAVPSGVSIQPFGYDETQKGAANRLAAMRQEIKEEENAILVSIENGVRYDKDEDKYFDFVHVIVEKNGVSSTHIQDCCIIPNEIIHEIDPEHTATTWGEIAVRKRSASSANNPHKEAIFGGISREAHIQLALNQALKKLNAKKEELITIDRVANLHNPQSRDRYIQRGIMFSPSAEQKSQDAIDLYNHGCEWKLDAEKAKRTDFQIFDTGDPFSLISPEIELDGANINIHVGVKHKTFSPLVLLQEALQLCRTASEHGAKQIKIALPEQYHPLLNPSDFNALLINLFKVSGAGNIYFYDKNYQGELPENNQILTCHKEPILKYLEWDLQDTLDEKVSHYMRKHAVTRSLLQCEMNQADIDKLLSADTAPATMHAPEMKNPPHILLCCSANKPFAMEIAESLKARGEAVKVFCVEGSGAQAVIPRDAKIFGAKVTIVQSTRPNPENIALASEYKINGASAYFFEAMMIARQAHLRGADHVNFVNPYQFSARSDKAEDNPKGKTGAYVQHNGLLLEAAGVNHVITAECHDPHTLSGAYTGKKIKGSAVQALTVISSTIAEQWAKSPHQGQFRLVTPDEGAAKRTKELTIKLEHILGKKMCDSRIMGEKERATHKDDSAIISHLNAGSIGINAQDHYLITDDETATGSTLCQAILNIKKQGAQDISVVVVHNNMPLDWLVRQMCLARFLVLGANDLHFGNTNEMGKLAKNYDDLIQTYSQMTSLSPTEVENKVLSWFGDKKAKVKLVQDDASPESFKAAFESFKAAFNELSTRVNVHNLADSFVDKFSHKKKAELAPMQNQTATVYAANTLFSASTRVNSVTKTPPSEATFTATLKAS